MNINEIYDLLGEFISTNLNIPVIELNQNAPFGIKPFITINITSTRILGSPFRLEVNDEGFQKTVLSKEIIVSFEAYSDNLHESDEILQSLEDALLCDRTFKILTNELVFVRSVNGVLSVSGILNDYSESRSLLECVFRYKQEINVDTGIIETVEIPY